MPSEQINRIIAEKVMGFTKHGHSSWLNPNDGEIWFLDEFDPYHRIEHAMMALEPLRKNRSLWLYLYQYASKDGPWRAAFEYGGMSTHSKPLKYIEADTPSAAICEAIVATLEGKE